MSGIVLIGPGDGGAFGYGDRPRLELQARHAHGRRHRGPAGATVVDASRVATGHGITSAAGRGGKTQHSDPAATH